MLAARSPHKQLSSPAPGSRLRRARAQAPAGDPVRRSRGDRRQRPRVLDRPVKPGDDTGR